MVLNNGVLQVPMNMDVRAGLTCGSHEWHTRDPWMMR